MILVHQRYFAKPGMAAAVLETRRRADRTLVELGLPVGRTYVAVEATGAGPDVVWECEYESMAARRAAEDVLDGSAAFTAVREEQGRQIVRFEREYYETDPGTTQESA